MTYIILWFVTMDHLYRKPYIVSSVVTWPMISRDYWRI